MKKRIFLIFLALAVLSSATFSSAFVSTAADSEYTEENNEKIDAPYEDALLELWFDHSSRNLNQSSPEPTGLYTYTVRMAKNEIENCQFFLYSLSGHAGLKVEVSDFTGPSTVGTELYYEHYIRMGDNGLMPDPLIPFGDSITLEAEKVQGFIVKVKTDKDTPAGNYTATVNVKDSDGNIIKTAKISLKVWDFVLSDETACDTAFGLSKGDIYSAHGVTTDDDGVLYKTYYDFLLENRICAYDLPYDLTDSRVDEYLDNPRVTSFHITGYKTDYSNEKLGTIYNKLSANEDWFEKGYFYYVDEPMNESALGEIASAGQNLASVYPGYQMLAPYFMNYEFGGKDMISIMEPYINIWCTKVNAWTPQGATGNGVVHMLSESQIAANGTYAQRMAKQVEGGDKNWVYYCWEPLEPYTTFDAAHEGIEQRVAFWQSYQNDVTGLLYFCVNEWAAVSHWNKIEKINAGGNPVYGDGTIVYCGDKLSRLGEENIDAPVSSMRLENIRDGIEDYQYLYMAEELFGEDTVNEFIEKITTDVITWTKDEDLLQNTRAALGDLIETATPKVYPESIEFRADSGIYTYGEVKQIAGMPAKTTAAALKGALINSNGIEIYKPNGMASLADDAYVYNGCIVRLYDEYGLLIDEATAVLMGDVNGDGNISLKDVSSLVKMSAGWDVDIDFVAANVNGDGKIDSKDTLALIRYLASWQVEFKLPAGIDYEIVGTVKQLTFTDVQGDERICDPEIIGDAVLSVAFTVQYGSRLDSITVPYAADGKASYNLELYKWSANGFAGKEPLARISGTSSADGIIALNLWDYDLGAGRYVFVLTGNDGLAPYVRNGMIGADEWSFMVDGEEETEFSIEAYVTVSYSARFDLSEDTTVSTMIRPTFTDLEIEGLTQSYTFLHITDSHLTLAYDDEFPPTNIYSEKRYQYAAARTEAFTSVTGINSADRFPYYMDYANMVGADHIFATGDMIDFPSNANIDTVFANNLAVSGIDFTYCFGNHDWSFNDNYVSDYARRNYAEKLFTDYIGEDTYFQAKEYDEFIIVAMDNSLDKFTADQLAKLKAESEKGKPIILLLHVPFCAPELSQVVKDRWNGRDLTLGPGTDISCDGNTLAMYEYVISNESNVAAIFAGHVHFNYEDIVGGRIPQYVTGDAYEGFARVVTLSPAAEK